jgi:hypothetical protein
MKVVVKQEALPEVKVEVPEVKVEVKDEPPSPPRGQPQTSHASKKARTEATPPPPPSEPWRAVHVIPPMYRRPDDRESAGYNTVGHLSAAEAGIIVIDDDEDDVGGTSTDVKGKAPL